MHVASIQFRALGLLVLGTLCSLVACSGGGGGGAAAAPAGTSGSASQNPSTVSWVIDAVEVAPGAPSLAAGAQQQFSATLLGTGSYSNDVTWSAQRGTISAAGLYTAPATAGADLITATSVQAPDKAGTATVTVTTPGASATLSAPTIAGPAEVQALAGPYTASTPLSPGVSASWAIVGGTLLTANSGASVQFQAGDSKFLTLQETLSNGSSTAFADRTVITLPFAPRNYAAEHRSWLATYKTSIGNEIGTGNINTYYSTSYYLHGLAAMAEATGDAAVTETLLGFCDQILALAIPVTRNGVTTQQLGPLDGNGNPPQNYGWLVEAALAHVAAVINSNAGLHAAYGARADKLVAFLHQAVFTYWFDKTTGVYANAKSTWLCGDIPWLPSDLGGWGSYAYWPQQVSHFTMIAAWLYQATGDALYQEAATRCAKAFQRRLVARDGHWTWDLGQYGWEAPDNQANCPDTSHANRIPMMMLVLYENGIVFRKGDMDLLARTFLDVIWNQSDTSPMFSNYIDGSNLAYRTVTASGGNGLVYHGWNSLGRVSPEVQRVMALTYNLVRTNSAANASIAANYSSYALVEMSGILARNVAP